MCSLSDLQLKGKLSLEYVVIPPPLYRNVLPQIPHEPPLLGG